MARRFPVLLVRAATSMKKRAQVIPSPTVETSIRTIRGQKVILDADLAAIYGVTPKRLNEQVKRNAKRFPPDFMFRLTAEERRNLRSQFATSSSGHGGRRYLPYAFTENGAVMAANVLNSPEAVRLSVFVVRAFVRMREFLSGSHELALELKKLEAKLTARLDVHETAIVDVLRRIMELLDPPPSPPAPPEKSPGFHTTMKVPAKNPARVCKACQPHARTAAYRQALARRRAPALHVSPHTGGGFRSAKPSWCQ